MAEKKHYLIKVWDVSGKNKQITDSKNKEPIITIPLENKHNGFNLIQEKIIKSYEKNIQNLYVPKGLRATYEEVKAPKEDSKKAHA
jgi:hypothetical protein